MTVKGRRYLLGHWVNFDVSGDHAEAVIVGFSPSRSAAFCAWADERRGSRRLYAALVPGLLLSKSGGRDKRLAAGLHWLWHTYADRALAALMLGELPSDDRSLVVYFDVPVLPDAA